VEAALALVERGHVLAHDLLERRLMVRELVGCLDGVDLVYHAHERGDHGDHEHGERRARGAAVPPRLRVPIEMRPRERVC
jgi:hypothetical protein